MGAERREGNPLLTVIRRGGGPSEGRGRGNFSEKVEASSKYPVRVSRRFRAIRTNSMGRDGRHAAWVPSIVSSQGSKGERGNDIALSGKGETKRRNHRRLVDSTFSVGES